MKSNALIIGSSKLHAATNLMWDEGIIRTRPEFIYTALGPEGRFQGVCSFAPTKGLSYMPLSSAASGLVSVVNGAAFFNAIGSCEAERISTQVFCGHGDTNIFQAEDYVIFQNLNTPTYWWRGEGDIVRSPGSVTEDWDDRAMPETVIEPVAPVASVYDCAQSLFIGLTVTLEYLADDDVCGAGHQCNAAIYNVYGNEVFIGLANLNNNNDGGTRIATFVLTDQQAADIAAASTDGETIGFRFACATTHPDFDAGAWDGGCHPEVGQLVITDSDGNELYNGCPAGTTIDIDVNPAP